MGANFDKPGRWKEDIRRSVDLYNDWFLRFAPKTYRDERVGATKRVEAMLLRTGYLRILTPSELREHPSILFALRMSTAPPIARDRLVGLADIPKSLVNSMEKDNRLPPTVPEATVDVHLKKIARMIVRLLDIDIFPWVGEKRVPAEQEAYRAATIVADRLCGANADPIVRNAQERRQLDKIKKWLLARGYKDITGKATLATMKPGNFAFRLNVPGLKEDKTTINIPVDAVVMPLKAKPTELPLMIEAKSAGDFTRLRRKPRA